jgi:cell division protein FtsN
VFGLFRLIGIGVALAIAAVVIEPSWNANTHSLTLRVRSARECVAVVRALSDRVASERVAEKPTRNDRAQARESQPPPVAAGPVALDEKPQEKLTDQEREVLDRLIEEKIREE